MKVGVFLGFLDKEEALEGEGEVDKESKRVPHSLKGRDIMSWLGEELRKIPTSERAGILFGCHLVNYQDPPPSDNSSLRSPASILSFFGNYITLYVLSSANSLF